MAFVAQKAVNFIDKIQGNFIHFLITIQVITQEIIEDVGYSNIEKRNLLTELGEKFNVEIKKILIPEQLEKYEKLISKKKK